MANWHETTRQMVKNPQFFFCVPWELPPPRPAEVQEFGKTVYDQHCLRCPGTVGRGGGPDAKSLTVKPANFHSPKSRMKSDGELIAKGTWGGVYSPMHGWGARLSRKEIHSVIRYIRLLAPYQSDIQ